MNRSVLAATILAVGITASGFLIGGRYSMTQAGPQIARLDRWTGQIETCLVKSEGYLTEQGFVDCGGPLWKSDNPTPNAQQNSN